MSEPRAHQATEWWPGGCHMPADPLGYALALVSRKGELGADGRFTYRDVADEAELRQAIHDRLSSWEGGSGPDRPNHHWERGKVTISCDYGVLGPDHCQASASFTPAQLIRRWREDREPKQLALWS